MTASRKFGHGVSSKRYAYEGQKKEDHMGRPKSDLLSGLGTWFEIARAITAEVLSLGGTDDNVRAILTNPGLKRQIAQLIVARPNAEKDSGSGAPATVYPVTVRKDRTLAQMVGAGRYDWKNEDITSEYFPDIGELGDYELELVHVARDASTEEAIAEIRSRGLEPAFIGMLLAFGERYPEIQRDFPVVALGSVCVLSRGFRYSPCLDVRGRERRLRLGWFGLGWGGHCRFLAFRRKVK